MSPRTGRFPGIFLVLLVALEIEADWPGRAARGQDVYPATKPLKNELLGFYEPAYFLVAPQLDQGCNVAAAPNLCRAAEPGVNCVQPHPARFFAVRIQPEALEAQAGMYPILKRAAEEAARAVLWNSISLVPSGVVTRRRFSLLKDWIVLGVDCPFCHELHWVALGFDQEDQAFELHTNSRVPASDCDQKLGARESPFARRANLAITLSLSMAPLLWYIPPSRLRLDEWVAPLDGGGWGVVTFRHPLTQKACPIELQLGFSADGRGAEFAFRGVSRSIRMIGEYQDKSLASPESSREIYDEQIQLYAVVATGAGIGDAASTFAREFIEGKGKTLFQPSQFQRYRLTRDKVLTLGVLNASRGEQTDFELTLDPQNMLVIRSPQGSTKLSASDEHLLKVKTGGFVVQLLITTESCEGDGVNLGFLFLPPG